MAIKWGSTYVTAVKWGSTNCTTVYWGSTKVFPDSIAYDGSTFAYPMASGFDVTYYPTSYPNTTLTTISATGLEYACYRLSATSNMYGYYDSFNFVFTSKDKINLSMYNYLELDCGETIYWKPRSGSSAGVYANRGIHNYGGMGYSEDNSSWKIRSSYDTTVKTNWPDIDNGASYNTMYWGRWVYKIDLSNFTNANKTYYIKFVFYCEGGTRAGNSYAGWAGDNVVRVKIYNIKFT